MPVREETVRALFLRLREKDEEKVEDLLIELLARFCEEQPIVWEHLVTSSKLSAGFINGVLVCYEVLRQEREAESRPLIQLSDVELFERTRAHNEVPVEFLQAALIEEEPHLMTVPYELYFETKKREEKTIAADIIRGFYFCWWLFGRRFDLAKMN